MHRAALPASAFALIMTAVTLLALAQPAATEAQEGGIIGGNKPPVAGGFGTFAFGGGTFAQLLEASECPEETATFFYNKPDGSFAVYIPGSDVTIVNEEFLGIFNGEPAIDETTIFTAKCM